MIGRDNTPPTILNCPQPVAISIPTGSSTGIATWQPPTAFDDSGVPPTLMQSNQPGDAFPVGVSQVTYIYTDQAGNNANCQFTVTGKLNCFKLDGSALYVYIYLCNEMEIRFVSTGVCGVACSQI